MSAPPISSRGAAAGAARRKDETPARRTAVVTGAASGVGREVTLALVAAGYAVAAVDINAAALSTLSALAGLTDSTSPRHRANWMDPANPVDSANVAGAEPANSGALTRTTNPANRADAARPANPAGSVIACTCDVADPASVTAAIGAARAALGPIDLLVNAAGIAAGGPVTSPVAALARAAMEVNFLGTVHCVEAVLPDMLARGAGTIVNISSLSALVPCQGMGGYAASKAAVAMYTAILGLEAAPRGLQVVCLCPPAVNTPLLARLLAQGAMPTMIRRFMRPLEPADIAAAVLRAATRRGRTIVVPGLSARALWRVTRWAPHLTQALCTRFLALPAQPIGKHP